MRKVFERFKNLRKKLTNLSYIDKKSDAKKKHKLAHSQALLSPVFMNI